MTRPEHDPVVLRALALLDGCVVDIRPTDAPSYQPWRQGPRVSARRSNALTDWPHRGVPGRGP